MYVRALPLQTKPLPLLLPLHTNPLTLPLPTKPQPLPVHLQHTNALQLHLPIERSKKNTAKV